MDKPLHVLTAEAIGWTGCYQIGSLWMGVPPNDPESKEVPAYGKTWCSTGKLCDDFVWELERYPDRWEASSKHLLTRGQTAVEAIANLVVAVHENKGKLKR